MHSWKSRLINSIAVCVCSQTGCADNESSIFIRQVIHPGTDCVLVADPSGLARSKGVLDVALVREYKAGLLIGNQLVSRASSDELRTETAAFRAEGIEARVEKDDMVFGEFSTAVHGFVWPGTSGSPGWGSVSGVMVDVSSSESIKKKYADNGVISGVKRVETVVKVFGHTLGGQKIDSGEFRFPVDVCYGCLVGADVDAGGDAEKSVTCIMGQDDLVSLTACREAGFPYCQ